jgi:hypothetical protein
MATSRATRIAREILKREGVTAPSVPVEKIARRHARIVPQELPAGISGMLVPLPPNPSQKSWAIVVNRSHAIVRRRFTIAHELGHLLLHRYSQPHADAAFKVRFRDGNSSLGSIREEIEANQFAAELLMPEALLVIYLSEIGLVYGGDEIDDDQLEQIARLATKFGVSAQSLSFRIANLAQP